MQQAPTVLIILLGISGMILVYMAAWAQLRHRVPAAREFSLLSLAIALYILGYAIEITRIDLKGALEAIRIEYLGLAFLPALILMFALTFVRQKRLPAHVIALLLVIPLITLGLVFTIEQHNLYYVNPQVVQGEFFAVLTFERGPWYNIQITYLMTAATLAVILFFINAVRSEKKRRRQAVAVAIGSLIPVVEGFLYFNNLIPGNIDAAPFALALSVCVFAVALFKLGLFEIVPAAREMAIDSVREGFLVVDRLGQLHDLNKAARLLPGAEELKIGQRLPPDNPLVLNLSPLLDGSNENVGFTVDHPYGKACYYNARAYTISDPFSGSGGIAILISDVSETTGLVRQLHHQANTDELTGILNRRHLMELGSHQVDLAQRTGMPLGVILIDLDHFKTVNDRFGHQAGDDVLRRVADCFRHGVRSVDILGRYGGEEFVVFLPGADLNGTIHIAGRLKQALASADIRASQEPLTITASFGVHSTVPCEGETIDDLLKSADRAQYEAKARGRNCVAWLTPEN